MVISIEHFLNDDYYFKVVFTGEIKWENNGIGIYEYGSATYYDAGTNYPVLWDDPKWDETLYTEKENLKIKEFLEDEENYQLISDLLEKQALKYDNSRDTY
jgi:hypothetical protein